MGGCVAGATACTAMCLLLVGVPGTARGAEADIVTAAAAGDLARVKALIEAGADVDARDKDGTTALMAAFKKRHLKVAKALIAAGADVETWMYDGLVRIKVGNKYGLKDHEGRIVAVPRFGYISPCGEGLFEVCVDCEQMEGKRKRGRLAVYSALKSWGYIDKTGRFVIPPQFDETRSFSGGFAVVRVGCAQEKKRDWTSNKRGGKCGYIDKSGRYLVPPRYDHARRFREGMGAVCVEEEARPAAGRRVGFCRLRRSRKWGFVDGTGREVIPPRFRVANDYSEGLAAVRSSEDGTWGYIDKKGEYAIESEFQLAKNFSMGLAPVRPVDERKWGYIDTKGRMVINPQYDRADGFIADVGCAYVEKDGRRWMINRQGKILKEVGRARTRRRIARDDTSESEE